MTLTFDLVTLNQKGSSLVMTKLPTMFGESRPKLSLVIDWKPFGLRTDQKTDPPTIAKQYTPSLLVGGIIMKKQFICSLV